MLLEHFSHWIARATLPSYKYYTPLQCALAASTGILATYVFTRISPIRGMTLCALSWMISQLITPFFVKFFQPYSKTPFVPFTAQVLQVGSSLSIAFVTCNCIGLSLKLREAAYVSLAFITVDAISTFILFQYRLHKRYGKNLPF